MEKCKHENLKVFCIEETVQNFDTTKGGGDVGWCGSADFVDNYYPFMAICEDCKKDDFTFQELADLTGLRIYDYQRPLKMAAPEEKKNE